MSSVWKRAGWLFLALLFLLTGLGVGVLAFWTNTHPDKSSQTPQTQNTCQIQQAVSKDILPIPSKFSVTEKVNKLQITDLQTGNGPKVKPGDCLTVKYYGSLANSGKQFDENFDKPLALKLQIGTGQVIQGWDQGVIGMKVGGTRRLVIPSNLGYGPQASGSIPANSDLVFVVKVEAAQ